MTDAAPDPGQNQGQSEEPWLSPGVAGVGAASLFSDAGHEMATSVLPTFLTSTLHAGPAALGAIEGFSDALVGLSKLAGGPLANEPGRRGRLASGGYLGTAIATAAIGLTTAVWQVAILRAVAWASRGIRSPARDMLLTSLAPKSAYGRAFGLERAGDNAGAILGPLLASVLVSVVGIRHVILLAIIPGVFAAISITIAARQARTTLTAVEGRRTLTLNIGELRRAGLARALAPAALFELGNLATTLLILRATNCTPMGAALPPPPASPSCSTQPTTAPRPSHRWAADSWPTASARAESSHPEPPSTSWATRCSPGSSTSGPSC